MSRERLANAFDKAAEAMAELALELRASDSPSREAAAPVAESAHPAPAARAAGAVPPAPAASAPSALSRCPVHSKPWTIKEGGISKNGNPYPAFWKCSERDDNGYCDKKPERGWAQSHPAEEALMAEAGF